MKITEITFHNLHQRVERLENAAITIQKAAIAIHSKIDNIETKLKKIEAHLNTYNENIER